MQKEPRRNCCSVIIQHSENLLCKDRRLISSDEQSINPRVLHASRHQACKQKMQANMQKCHVDNSTQKNMQKIHAQRWVVAGFISVCALPIVQKHDPQKGCKRMDLTPLEQTNKQQQKIRIASTILPVFSSRVRLIRGVGVGRGPIELLLLLRIFPELRVVAKGKVYSFRVYEEDLNEIC